MMFINLILSNETITNIMLLRLTQMRNFLLIERVLGRLFLKNWQQSCGVEVITTTLFAEGNEFNPHQDIIFNDIHL